MAKVLCDDKRFEHNTTNYIEVTKVSTSKGTRIERKFQDWMEQRGYITEKHINTMWQNTDYFNVFDIVCIKPKRPTVWVQVQNNSPLKKKIKRIKDFCKKHFVNTFNVAWSATWEDYARYPDVKSIYPPY